ncbi:Integrase core domain protein [Polystyrenella longa]|uniref:Integrase core domain protein n=1 Tax=Polystyrenella longa TaxID=2528007 RepID=A0A518CT99_9PLAN|nr:integrase core domain-containing protein [Polystyrenella longa]QDU82453.1 Integrase core domain protein [Polystyrenella longa]
MNFQMQHWHLLVLALASWINREQQQAIEYLQAENRVLREKLGKKRILLNDDQRGRLAAKGKALGRKLLREIGTIFTPDTILRWHRELIARKWDYSSDKPRVGRPRIRQEVVEQMLRFAKQNPTWGADRIQGALANVGYHITYTTVRNVLKANGIEPVPNRPASMSWQTFLKAHWETIFAVDFTTVEVWTKTGLTTFYIMVVMELKSRRVEIAGITTNPNKQWVTQVARNLTGSDEYLENATHLILDRDGSFQPFRTYLHKMTNIEPVLLPPKSPNMNAYLERFMRSLKSECLDKMIFFGQHSLERALKEYVAHYHFERNHQGLDNQLIDPDEEVGCVAGKIECRERLGGLLKYYYRDAA